VADAVMFSNSVATVVVDDSDTAEFLGTGPWSTRSTGDTPTRDTTTATVQ